MLTSNEEIINRDDDNSNNTWYEGYTDILYIADWFCLNWNDYAFINKDRTIKQIANNNFVDTTNPDFFIMEENDKNLIFANSLWLRTVCVYMKGFLVNYDKIEYDKLLIREELSYLPKNIQVNDYLAKLEEYLNDLIKKLDDFVKVLDDLNSIKDTFIINTKNGKPIGGNIENYSLNNIVSNGKTYLQVKKGLLRCKYYEMTKPEDDSNTYPNDAQKLQQDFKNKLFWITNNLSPFFYHSAKNIIQILNITMNTLKVQNHLFFIITKTILNFQNSLNDAISNNNIEKLLLKVQPIYTQLAELSNKEKTYLKLEKVRNSKNDPALTGLLQKLNIKASNYDIDLLNLIRQNVRVDDNEVRLLMNYYFSLAEYKIISNDELKNIAQWHASKCTFLNKESFIENSGYNSNNTKDVQLYNLMNSWWYNSFYKNLMQEDYAKNVQVSTNKYFTSKEDVFVKWQNNNASQPDFDYGNIAFLCNITDPYLLCYKLDLTNQQTKNELLKMAEYYTNMYKLWFLGHFSWSKLNFIANENEKSSLLPEKWKYHENTNTNYKDCFLEAKTKFKR